MPHLHFTFITIKTIFKGFRFLSQKSPIPQPSEVLRPLPQDLSLLLVSQIIWPIRTQAKPLLLPACACLCVWKATLGHVMTQNTDPLRLFSGLWSQIYVRKGINVETRTFEQGGFTLICLVWIMFGRSKNSDLIGLKKKRADVMLIKSLHSRLPSKPKRAPFTKYTWLTITAFATWHLFDQQNSTHKTFGSFAFIEYTICAVL